MSLSAIPATIREQVFRRDGGRCQYCHLAQIGQAAVFHINHVIPKSRGGSTNLLNLVLQCPNCSLQKSNKFEAIDPATGQMHLLFHPLRQTWDEHFMIVSGGFCMGVTPTGRATVEALGMNNALPRIARSLQIHLGLLTEYVRESDE